LRAGYFLNMSQRGGATTVDSHFLNVPGLQQEKGWDEVYWREEGRGEGFYYSW